MKDLRYPLVCFDLDGTLVDDTVFIWTTLHETFKTDSVARKRAYDDYFGGRITYRDWFETDLELLRRVGATKQSIERVLTSLKPMPGAIETLTELKRRGHIICVVSGSLDIVVDHLFGEDVFDHILINKIWFDENGRIAGGEPTPFDLKGKADGLRMLAKREGIPLSATAFIGDNHNDLWIARAAGLSVAFNCKSEELRIICQKEIKDKDLRHLLNLVH